MSQPQHFKTIFTVLVLIAGIALVALIATYLWNGRDQSLTSAKRLNGALSATHEGCAGNPEQVTITLDAVVVHCQSADRSRWARWERGKLRESGTAPAAPSTLTFPLSEVDTEIVATHLKAHAGDRIVYRGTKKGTAEITLERDGSDITVDAELRPLP